MENERLLETLRLAIGKQTVLGANISLERAIEILISHIVSNPDQGARITYFFPWYANLKPVDVHGVPPKEGDEVFLRELETVSPPDQNYREWMSWRVKSVTHSITPITDINTLLRKLAFGEGGNSCRIEVQLYKGRRWRE